MQGRIKEIIHGFILKLLVLEIHIRGRRIKPSPWRLKLKKQLQKYYVMEYVDRFRLFFNSQKKILYLEMPKVGCSSLRLTLITNESVRDEIYLDFKKLQGGDPAKTERWKFRFSVVLNWIFRNNYQMPAVPKNALFLSDIKGVYYIPAKKEWMLSGCNEIGLWHQSINLDDINSNFIFTFVRNPFSRFVSFFLNRYRKKNWRKSSYFIKADLSFDKLVRMLYKLPDCYLENHSFPQYLRIESFTRLGGKIDFIGKFENLKEEFESIQRRFALLPLEYINTSIGKKGNWRDYYTPKTAKLIYKRYRKDFEMFGYEDEYPKLLDYLASKP